MLVAARLAHTEPNPPGPWNPGHVTVEPLQTAPSRPTPDGEGRHHPRPRIYNVSNKFRPVGTACLRSAPGTASVYKMRLRADPQITDQSLTALQSKSREGETIEGSRTMPCPCGIDPIKCSSAHASPRHRYTLPRPHAIVTRGATVNPPQSRAHAD